MTENEIGKVVVDAALKVHRELGPGLLETVYEVVLARELESRGLQVERAQLKSCRDDEIIVQGKRGTSAALGRRQKNCLLPFSPLVWRA